MLQDIQEWALCTQEQVTPCAKTTVWKGAIDSFADVLAQHGFLVDCSSGFWKERRSMCSSRTQLGKRVFEQARSQVLTRELCRSLFLLRMALAPAIRAWSNDEVFASQHPLGTFQRAAGVSPASPTVLLGALGASMEPSPKTKESPILACGCAGDGDRRDGGGQGLGTSPAGTSGKPESRHR